MTSGWSLWLPGVGIEIIARARHGGGLGGSVGGLGGCTSGIGGGFTKNMKELRDRDRLVTIEVKGRVVSNGERRDDDPRRRDLVIDDAELIKIED